MDWTSVVIPIGSTLVGAYASYLGTSSAQKKALAAARQARVDASQDAGVAALSESFTAILRHLRTMPKLPVGENQGTVLNIVWKDSREKELWSETLQDLVGPARMAARTLRDEHVRRALLEVFDLLEEWQNLDDAYRAHYGPQVVLRVVADQGVLCLTAFLLEEQPPVPTEVYRDAKAAYDNSCLLLQMDLAEEEADRAARLARRAGRPRARRATRPVMSPHGTILDHVTTTQTGHVPSQAEILGAVRELHAAGQNTISPMQALEHLSSGYTEASETVDFDLVFPTVVHIFEQAGRDGVLTIEGAGSTVLAVFPTESD